jgi:hypothetical protein
MLIIGLAILDQVLTISLQSLLTSEIMLYTTGKINQDIVVAQANIST